LIHQDHQTEKLKAITLMYKTIIHGWQLMQTETALLEQMIECIGIMGKPLCGCWDVCFKKVLPQILTSGEFSGDESDFSSSSSSMISTERQFKLQNAFSPLQNINESQY